MKANWYPWIVNISEGIGEVRVHGIKRVIYQANTNSSSFQVGQPLIVPSTLFKDEMMNLKLPLIQERRLSHFTWYGMEGKIVGRGVIPSSPCSKV